MTGIRLPEAKAITLAEEREQETERTEALHNFDRDFKNSGLKTQGPSPDDYDYQDAYVSGVKFETDESGGFNLSNKYSRGLYISGKEVLTGETLQNIQDPNGYGQYGYDKMSKSYVNTQTGQPVEDYDALTALYINHLENGGTDHDFDVPSNPDMVNRSKEFVHALGSIENNAQWIEQQIADPDPQLLSSPEGEPPDELSVEQWNGDQKLTQSSQLIADWLDYAPDPDKNMNELLLEEMAILTNNTKKMGELIYAYETGDMPPEVAQAYAYALYHYDRLTPFNIDSFLGATAGILTDPFTYASGFMGKALYTSLGKRAGVRALIGRLAATKAGQVAAGAAGGATAAGMEEGALSVSREATMQAVSGEGYDIGEMAKAGAFGGFAAALFGGPIGALLSRPGREGLKWAYNKVTDGVAESWAKATDAKFPDEVAVKGLPDEESVVIPDMPEGTTDFGVYMAGKKSVNSPWYSNLQRNVSQRWDRTLQLKGTPEETGKKEIGAQKVLDALDLWGRKAENGLQKFEGHEAETSGLNAYLQVKAEKGEKVTRDEIEDFLFANEPVINMNVSSVDDYVRPGQEYLKDVGKEELSYALFGDRLFRIDAAGPNVQVANEASELAEDSSRAATAYVREYGFWRQSQMDAEMSGEVPLSKPKSLTLDPKLRELVPDYADRMQDYINGSIARMDEGDFVFDMSPPFYVPPVEWTAAHLVNRKTGEVELFPNKAAAEFAIRSRSKNMAAGWTTAQLMEASRRLDLDTIHGPPRYEKLSFVEDGAENYREMRMYMTNNPRTNVEDIAEDYFGKPYESLTAYQKKRVNRVKDMHYDVPQFADQTKHYKLEPSRIGHIRMHDMYDDAGNKTLYVLEYQSDLPKASGATHPAAEVAGAKAVDEGEWSPGEESGTSMMINRMLQYAHENGYKKIMIPSTAESIAVIQRWIDPSMVDDMGEPVVSPAIRERHAKTINRYEQSVPIHFNKKIRKRWNLKNIRKGPAYIENPAGMEYKQSTPGGDAWIIEFGEEGVPEGPMPLYGMEGMASLNQEAIA